MTVSVREEVVDAEIVEDDLTHVQARDLTDRIRISMDGLWVLVVEAFQRRAHAALGYASWDAYCNTEFGSNRIRLPREERQETVRSLREAGLSQVAIASATGIDRKTIRSDIRASEGGDFPHPVGTDGKTYATPPRREPDSLPNYDPRTGEIKDDAPTPKESAHVVLINDLRGPWRHGITHAARGMTPKARTYVIEALEEALNEIKEMQP